VSSFLHQLPFWLLKLSKPPSPFLLHTILHVKKITKLKIEYHLWWSNSYNVYFT
jgi:hypothetical protein